MDNIPREKYFPDRMLDRQEDFLNAQFQWLVHEIHWKENTLENNPSKSHYRRFCDFNKKYSDFWSIINKKPPRADNDLQDYFLSLLCYTAFIENPGF